MNLAAKQQQQSSHVIVTVECTCDATDFFSKLRSRRRLSSSSPFVGLHLWLCHRAASLFLTSIYLHLTLTHWWHVSRMGFCSLINN